jgi:hypothetical protein
MTRRAIVTSLLLAVFLLPAAAPAQVLIVAPQTITFPSSDPDTVPVVSAAPVRVTYLAVGGGRGQAWTLTVRANGNLVSGPAQIPISNVTWVATPNPPFRNGTMSSTVAQTLASGPGPVALNRGTVTFMLANSWDYTAGNYTQTVVFTLSSP